MSEKQQKMKQKETLNRIKVVELMGQVDTYLF